MMHKAIVIAAALALVPAAAYAGLADFTWNTQVWDDFSAATPGNALAGSPSAQGGTWADGGADINIFKIVDDGSGNNVVEAHQSQVTGAAARYAWLFAPSVTDPGDISQFPSYTADANRLSFRAKFIDATNTNDTRGVTIQWADNVLLANGVADGTGVELTLNHYAGEAGWGDQIRSGAPPNNWIGTKNAAPAGEWHQYDMLMHRDGSNVVEWYLDGALFETMDFSGLQWIDDSGDTRGMGDIELFAVTRDASGLMTWFIDDVSIQYGDAVPEPAAFALLALGGLFVIRRRRA